MFFKGKKPRVAQVIIALVENVKFCTGLTLIQTSLTAIKDGFILICSFFSQDNLRSIGDKINESWTNG